MKTLDDTVNYPIRE